MESQHDRGFVLHDGTRFRVLPTGVLVTGEILCTDDVQVEVLKELAFVTREGERSLVKTRAFRYQAWKKYHGNILRCESADGHREYAHLHRYPFLGSDENETTDYPEPDDIPTLSEFLDMLERQHAAQRPVTP